jgi:hypothetical protein
VEEVGGRRWASPLLGGRGRGGDRRRMGKRGNRRESRNTQRRTGEQGDSSGLSWMSVLGKCVHICALVRGNWRHSGGYSVTMLQAIVNTTRGGEDAV